MQPIAVVTGANSGLGFEISRALVDRQFHVIFACRNEAKAQQAIDTLLAEKSNATLSCVPLDISNGQSITIFSKALATRVPHIDLLFNNAGIAAQPLNRTASGLEMQLATNFLGPISLTEQLIPSFNPTKQGRIINISSLAHRFAGKDIDDLNFEHQAYGEWRAYAQSKFALMCYTLELQAKLEQRNDNIIALSAHPGFAATNITATGMKLAEYRWGRFLLDQGLKMAPSAVGAAEAAIIAGCSSHVSGGEYYGPNGFLEISGNPGLAKINRHALNPSLRKELMENSEPLRQRL